MSKCCWISLAISSVKWWKESWLNRRSIWPSRKRSNEKPYKNPALQRVFLRSRTQRSTVQPNCSTSSTSSTRFDRALVKTLSFHHHRKPRFVKREKILFWNKIGWNLGCFVHSDYFLIQRVWKLQSSTTTQFKIVK